MRADRGFWEAMGGWRAQGPGEPGAQQCAPAGVETLAPRFHFPHSSGRGCGLSHAGDTDAERKLAQGKLDAW